MTSMSVSTLRPGAAVYVPLAVRKEEPAEQMHEKSVIIDLPSEVILLVFSQLTYKDALAAGLVCKQLLAEMATAPLSFSDTKASTLPACQASAYIADVSACFTKYAPGITSLDLSSVPVDDKDVLELCQLKKLQVLNLSGCKKLTARLCAALCEGAGSSSAALSQLQALDLQRCFQFNCECLSSMLSACDRGAVGLKCLAMSHLDMSCLAQQLTGSLIGSETPRHAPSCNSGSNLQMLALNNCTQLNARGLMAVAVACPRLSILLLGGSNFQPTELDTCTGELESMLQQAAAPMRSWELLSAVRTAVEDSQQLQLPNCSARITQLLTIMSTILSTVALVLPGLRAMELTFMAQPVHAAVSYVLETINHTLDVHAPEIWDFTQQAGVESALKMLRWAEAGKGAVADSSLAAAAGSAPLHAQSLAMVLKCAVNCSSSTRTTPLHVAAFSGNCCLAEQLLVLGSMVDARDVAGATPMFLAAEAGRALAVDKLLAAGGDAARSNVAGESPLYIASLKGHLNVVRRLVHGFMRRDVAWHKLRYVDGWTPLMAAAVANHYAVAHWLLIAAGTEAALELVRAANRYGQSVLHIAARKGTLQMLRLLLYNGGASVLGMADGMGETPVDVAIKHSHTAALAEFNRACARA